MKESGGVRGTGLGGGQGLVKGRRSLCRGAGVDYASAWELVTATVGAAGTYRHPALSHHDLPLGRPESLAHGHALDGHCAL